ncbi:Potassium-transporting ATPase ATP-binding subunit [uncultured archaeon]|nr:Potassium-transporting ATPase ATP-binding subunit [uncultured archaeon]
MGFLDSLAGKKQAAGTTDGFKPLLDAAHLEPLEALRQLGARETGLHEHEVRSRLRQYGHNDVGTSESRSKLKLALEIFGNPLVALMLVMALISFFTGQYVTTAIIVLMVMISTVLNYYQEIKADAAAEKLKALVRTTATVIRNGVEKEIPLANVVPGDIIHLSAGDIIPADVRLVQSKDLFINQSTLTGESLPVEKHAPAEKGARLFELQSICFMGTSVESGTAHAVAVLTGKSSYFGAIAESLEKKVETGFEKGIRDFTWLMIKLIIVMAPLVLLINGLKTGSWLEAFLYALAVIVGLTPELLPMIVSVNLAKGAVVMSQKKVIVKKLNSIQNFGAMDVLCTDKTGTLTQGKIILEKHLDVEGNESEEVLEYGYLNSFYQTGLKNVTDEAVLRHENLRDKLGIEKLYRKVDEVAFDFKRRRMSVVVERGGRHIFICKGAKEEIFSVCTHGEANGRKFALKGKHLEKLRKIALELNEEGFRIIAVAYKELEPEKKVYSAKDEHSLTLMGFMAFLDPPKESAAKALAVLAANGIAVKVLTGDNDVVTRKICRDVGLEVTGLVLGDEMDRMNDGELLLAAVKSNVFAKLAPAHKERIVRILRANGHVVGFMGDGINDAPALRAADVGISVDTAADIAKESSSIILLEKSLLVLNEGVIEGRKVFGNIDKYIKMAASSNFGNMFSVLGASLVLPFLPMLPLQVLTNNLLYDFSQATIPTDNVDKEWVEKPRKWTVESIRSFIFFIGPISSLFDFTTFAILIFLFNGWYNQDLFHTGWFVESLMTQTLIIHIIRTNRIPILESRASPQLIASSLIITAVGVALPFSPLAPLLGFVPLPLPFIGLLVATVIVYFALTHTVKGWVARRYGLM